MVTIRNAKAEDRDFWFSLDKHLSEAEFEKKIRDRMGYVLFENNVPVGVLRYNLFWDNTPFCTLIYVDSEHQHQGYGRSLMERFEQDMRELGYGMVMVSTQVNETAQHFYRKLGYRDAGCLVIDIPKYSQPMELFLVKEL